LNEDLTRSRATLAGKARHLVKNKKAQSTWVTRGVILVKLFDGSVKKIANDHHFAELELLVGETESTDLELGSDHGDATPGTTD